MVESALIVQPVSGLVAGITRDDGATGAEAVIVQKGARASATSAGLAYRSSGRLAIILRRMAATAGGTSARTCSIGCGSSLRCATSFSSHPPSGNAGWPARLKYPVHPRLNQ